MSARCWRKMIQELDRTAPEEGVAVPLVALRPRSADPNPCAPIELEALAEVVIAAVVLVPPDLQVNRAMRVHVRPDTDRVLNRRIERLVERFPRLRPCAYLHSHPFARGSTWPSRGPGCDYEGHMIPLLEKNQEAGLNASFSFIACRDWSGTAWVLRAFALDRRRAIVDLGSVDVAADEAPRVRDALEPGLRRRADARDVLDRLSRELAQRGLPFEIDDLFDGWIRTIVELGTGSCLVLLMPIDFPGRPPALYRVDRRTGGHRRIALPVTAPGAPGGPADWLAAVAADLDRGVHADEEVEHVGS